MKPPISDPCSAPEPTPPEPTGEIQIFRVHFGKAFLTITLWVWIIAVITIFFLTGFESAKAMAVRELPLALAYGAVSTLFFGFLLPVRVIDSTLQSTNFWGLRKQFSFAEIVEVKPLWFFFPYLLLSGPKGEGKMWLPFFLSDTKGFAKAVKEKTVPDNPLHLYLLSRGL